MATTASEVIGRISNFLRLLPENVRKIAAEAMAEYFIGNTQHGLKHYPPYKHVPWASIGGFVSDKQRRYVMTRIREGSITPGISASNGYFRDAWKYEPTDKGYVITNDVAYAPYLVGPGDQSRRAVKQGWRQWPQILADNMKGALTSAVVALNRWLKEHIGQA